MRPAAEPAPEGAAAILRSAGVTTFCMVASSARMRSASEGGYGGHMQLRGDKQTVSKDGPGTIQRAEAGRQCVRLQVCSMLCFLECVPRSKVSAGSGVRLLRTR